MAHTLRKVVTTALIGAAAAAAPVVAYASGPNYGSTWESLGGAVRNGYVQVQRSHWEPEYGCYPRWAYQRFVREAGPSLDTGRLYTSASSWNDVQSRHDWVWDSPLWGDRYVTQYYWGLSC